MSFVVNFSTVPSGQAPGPSEHYRQRERDLIEQAKEQIKLKFIKLTADRLRKIGVSEKHCDELGHHVMEGKEIRINADSDTSYSTEYIYAYYRYSKKLKAISAFW